MITDVELERRYLNRIQMLGMYSWTWTMERNYPFRVYDVKNTAPFAVNNFKYLLGRKLTAVSAIGPVIFGPIQTPYMIAAMSQNPLVRDHAEKLAAVICTLERLPLHLNVQQIWKTQ